MTDAGFSALSHPLRRHMLARLAGGRRTISDFADGSEMTFAAVSRHLKVLEEAGLVSRRVEGREHYFAVRPDGLAASKSWIDEQSRLWQNSLEVLRQLMENEMADGNSLVARAQVHIAAPAEKVFAAWLDPRIAAKFLGVANPGGGDLRLDARPGGELFIVMGEAPKRVSHRGEFLLVDAPRRLVFTWLSTHTGLRTTVVAVDFTAEGGGTRVDLVHEGFASDADASAHRGGWAAIFKELAAIL